MEYLAISNSKRRFLKLEVLEHISCYGKWDHFEVWWDDIVHVGRRFQVVIATFRYPENSPFDTSRNRLGLYPIWGYDPDITKVVQVVLNLLRLCERISLDEF